MHVKIQKLKLRLVWRSRRPICIIKEQRISILHDNYKCLRELQWCVERSSSFANRNMNCKNIFFHLVKLFWTRRESAQGWYKLLTPNNENFLRYRNNIAVFIQYKDSVERTERYQIRKDILALLISQKMGLLVLAIYLSSKRCIVHMLLQHMLRREIVLI